MSPVRHGYDSLNQRNYNIQNEHYALVPKVDVPRSTFNRRHEHKTTGNGGMLIPVYVDEVLPGDVHTGHMTIFARLNNLIFPLMDNARFETQFFFVPARLVWDNWKKFMGEQQNPGDSISYLIPTTSLVGATDVFGPSGEIHLQLADYMGIPIVNVPNTNTLHFNSLPFRAYNLIYNEWYRDENIQNSRPVPTGDGPDVFFDNFGLLVRGKIHDYFTSALPSPQKGPAVTIPTFQSNTHLAPITGFGPQPTDFPNPGSMTVVNADGSQTSSTEYWDSTQLFAIGADVAPGIAGPAIYADLSSVVGASINALRLAVATQKLLERDMRGGTRYTELLQQHWGVHPQDSRLQRPEYIGGGQSAIQTAAIAQTSATGGTGTPQGNLAGQSTITGQHSFSMVAQEHGYIIGLGSLMTTPTYQQGLHRMWSRQTRYDFAWPEFVAIGEQAVNAIEIWAHGDSGDDIVFGYQERYAEYRFVNNRISGLFRSNTVGSIDTWHLAQNFSSRPTLSDTFIQETAPWQRVLAGGADVSGMQFLADMLFEVKTTRALPAYGVPGSQIGTF